MILRYGLAHLFVFVAPMVLLLAVVVPVLWVMSKFSKGAATSPSVEKIVKQMGGLCFFVMPFVLFFWGTTVWVIDDGEDGALAGRKYLLFGKSSSVKRVDGQVIEFRAEPGRGDVVVNASSVHIQSEEVAYGQGAAGIPLERILMDPGVSRAVATRVEGVGSPPYTAELKGRVRSAVKTYIHR